MTPNWLAAGDRPSPTSKGEEGKQSEFSFAQGSARNVPSPKGSVGLTSRNCSFRNTEGFAKVFEKIKKLEERSASTEKEEQSDSSE